MSLRIGLTGGIASGKSTVAALLAQHGAAIIDTDLISHALTASGGAAITAIAAQFGPAMIHSDGSLKRAQMRELIFSNVHARQQLEQVLHPMIRAEAEQQALALAATAPYLIFVVPLLVESADWRDRVDRILLVNCDETAQLERLMQRNQLSATQAHAMLAAQANRKTRLAHATDVIDNHGDVAALRSQVTRLDALYRQSALSLLSTSIEAKK